ncbi:PhzF family phenazine biosynthesis protein [Jannaschia sp. Os4]|uniref:PhzF family phenazine biosynthesis protein n=1 Tax=Jannaschia sp. Os4 TaxID=2807617 RepID=UPI0019397DDA|nr:PhzF family phenazine biosynthesis protein [Jannaschia sp. Os4]MBM2577375.1 PhzF family phenazine biosynthesis protein [Jannaschia sp. Os4]
MTQLEFEIWDVFTDRPFAGNPLAVVTGADDLSTAQMQTLARQFNLSETIFLMAPRDPAHTARARIFFPTAEIPFAGHPTVGAALLLAGRDGLDRVVLEEEAGLVPVEIDGAAATFDAPVLPARAGAADAAEVAEAVSLEPGDVAGPCEAWSGGPCFLFVPVASREALARAAAREFALTSVLRRLGATGAYLHDPDGNARMFAPQDGIPEDPATGSASAILAGPLLAAGRLAEGVTERTLVQGEDMGRRSEIGLAAEVRDGALVRVRITGRAVPVMAGRTRVPPA